MPKSATGPIENLPRRAAAAGFTLVEVLVVMVIAAIVTGVVLLRLPGNGDEAALEREIQRLRASLEVMCDQALMTGNARGLRFHANGYDFWTRAEGAWQPRAVSDRPAPVTWPEGMRSRVQIGGQALSTSADNSVQVVCSALEPPTPFTLELHIDATRRTLQWP